MYVFRLKKRVIQRIKLENKFKLKKCNKTPENFETAKIRRIEKQKTKTRLDERDEKAKKSGNLKKNKPTHLRIVRLKKKVKNKKRKKDTFNFDHKENNRVIWTNLNYKDEEADLTKCRPPDKFEIAKLKRIEMRKNKTRLNEKNKKAKKDGRLKENKPTQKAKKDGKLKKNKPTQLGIVCLKKKGKSKNKKKDTFNFHHKENNRIIWTNLNYKDEEADLTKFRPYLIKSIAPSGRKLLFELMTMTSQDWKADFKYEIELNPQCLKKEKTSFIYLNTLVYVKAKKKNLKSLFKCDCKNCLSEKEYNLVITLQKEFQGNNQVKRIEIDGITQT
ncbi:3985_t:CDS:1 [Dentiscutata heterogama]|uniref:3985_t:CDS:1 n=1 Tax=Dentiscutata heterogama TaxID=1316150 RepID=A0ACA9KTZ5_9GLOM|nr:3985_t:CDS:1 [Dentiscutata heterogama]